MRQSPVTKTGAEEHEGGAQHIEQERMRVKKYEKKRQSEGTWQETRDEAKSRTQLAEENEVVAEHIEQEYDRVIRNF